MAITTASIWRIAYGVSLMACHKPSAAPVKPQALGYMPKGTLIPVFIVAVSLNYLWELAQAPLYVGLKRYNIAVFWHCFVASLGDGIMVLLIIVVGWIVLKRWDWFRSPGVTGYLLMLMVGLILAVLIELVAVDILGRWEYTDKMPTLPGVRIGLVPIAQMLILPPLIFQTVTFLGSKKT